MTEWRPFCGLYEASDDGRVRRATTGRVLGTFKAGAGYDYVALSRTGARLSIGLHVVVCTAFHGPKPSPDMQVAHWNGDKSDNRPANLRWATAIENAADKIRHRGGAPINRAVTTPFIIESGDELYRFHRVTNFAPSQAAA